MFVECVLYHVLPILLQAGLVPADYASDRLQHLFSQEFPQHRNLLLRKKLVLAAPVHQSDSAAVAAIKM